VDACRMQPDMHGGRLPERPVTHCRIACCGYSNATGFLICVNGGIGCPMPF